MLHVLLHYETYKKLPKTFSMTAAHWKSEVAERFPPSFLIELHAMMDRRSMNSSDRMEIDRIFRFSKPQIVCFLIDSMYSSTDKFRICKSWQDYCKKYGQYNPIPKRSRKTQETSRSAQDIHSGLSTRLEMETRLNESHMGKLKFHENRRK